MQRLYVHHCLRTSFRDSHPLEHPVHSALVKKETPGVPNKQLLPGTVNTGYWGGLGVGWPWGQSVTPADTNCYTQVLVFLSCLTMHPWLLLTLF